MTKLGAQQNNKEERKKAGRPTDYSPELAEEICDAIACTSKGVAKLCEENKHWPCPRALYKWLTKHDDFMQMYARAKQFQIEVLVNEIIQISDDSSQDFVLNEEGKIVADHEHIQRSKLKIDTRKWLASKLVPRIYGDKIQTEHSGSINSAINEISQKQQNEAILDAANKIKGIIKPDSECCPE